MVAFAFTILKEGVKAYGPTENYCIAEPEECESMKLCLRDIIEDVGKLEKVNKTSCPTGV